MKRLTSTRDILKSGGDESDIRAHLAKLISSGIDRDAIFAEMEELRSELRVRGREDEEDTVMEVMDYLVGWCSPHNQL